MGIYEKVVLCVSVALFGLAIVSNISTALQFERQTDNLRAAQNLQKEQTEAKLKKLKEQLEEQLEKKCKDIVANVDCLRVRVQNLEVTVRDIKVKFQDLEGLCKNKDTHKDNFRALTNVVLTHLKTTVSDIEAWQDKEGPDEK